MGELVTVTGADCESDIGAIVDIYQHKMGNAALLFADIPGYAPGFRVVANTMTSQSRIALTLGLPPSASTADLIDYWRDYFSESPMIAPREVTDGPILDNVLQGTEIDLRRFPVPLWHEHDGGPYIGTGSLVIQRDPDSEWVNGGTYRVQLQGDRDVSLYISKGKHGQLIMQKYWDRGLPCPVAISCGHDPLLVIAGGAELPVGVSEFDAIGGMAGTPLEVLKGPTTGLPIPANAEIVIEGEIHQGDVLPEGPFGEFTGYYASGAAENPRVRVTSVLYRNDPIILGNVPAVPPNDDTYFGGYLRSALLWNQLERAGITGIRGVWGHEAGGGHYWFTISIDQLYPGHSKQVGTAAQACHVGAYCNKYIVVVDADIDPTNIDQVIWAMCSRVDPPVDVETLQRCWSTGLDPTAHRAGQGFLNSRMVIDACRPWERITDFPMVARASKSSQDGVRRKFPHLFDDDGHPVPIQPAGGDAP